MSEPENARELVSVIIPTFNSARTLEACLQSISNQCYPRVEVVVVDQSSRDGTVAIAERFECRIVHVPPPSFYSPPSASRNLGASHAKGSILYHLDSDMEVTRDLIVEIVDRFDQSPQLGALVVHEFEQPKRFWPRCKAFERRCYWGNENIESARVVRRSIFEQVGGYDDQISCGEDFDVAARYTELCSVGACTNVVWHDASHLTFLGAIKKKYNYAKTADRYLAKYPGAGFRILSEELKCFMRNYKLFLDQPLVGMGSLVLKSGELLAGGVSMLVGTVARRGVPE